MKEIPNRLQCSYCIRNYSHGGECQERKSRYDERGCLVFKLDPKGCIKNKDMKLQIPLYREIPFLNIWDNGWELNGVETEIRIKQIYGLSWDSKSGYLIIHCNLDYYINEYSDDYIEPKNKKKFKLIK